MNPLLVTLPGGRVQTTEKPMDYVEPSTTTTTTTTTTTLRPLTTTTTRATTTTTTTARPLTTTTTYRPIIITTTAAPPSAFRSTFTASSNTFGGVATTKKPFNIFDFYLKNFNTQAPKVYPAFQSRFSAPQRTFTPVVVATPQLQPVVLSQPKQVPAPQNTLIKSPGLVSTTSNLLAKGDPKPVLVTKPNLSVPLASIPVQTLEQKVAPPLTSSHQKVKLNPVINIQLEDSGHKFINRFVVDEEALEGPITGKSKLDKEVSAPPVKNVKPILSPKISVHVGESGHRFINRFVLTNEEKNGNNKTPGKSLLKNRVDENAQQAVEVAKYPTDFTKRFEVDEVNKKLFQTAAVSAAVTTTTTVAPPPFAAAVRAPQSQIFFNNRFNEGVNTFHYEGATSYSHIDSRSSRTLDNTPSPLFSRLNLQLPSFDHFKKQRL